MQEPLRSQIIEKVVWNAISKGWRPGALPSEVRRMTVISKDRKIWIGEKDGFGVGWREEFLLTSESFAKAYFGKDWTIKVKELMFSKDIAEYLQRTL